MKIFLVLLVSLVLNQNVFAEGDPNLAMPDSGSSAAGHSPTFGGVKSSPTQAGDCCLGYPQNGPRSLLGHVQSLPVTSSSGAVNESSGPVKTGN